MSKQKEPFGYFRAEPFGWMDCAETDEDAVALYDQETVNALQKHCDGFAEQAAFQRDARLGVLKELAKVEGQRDMLLDVLRKTADDLAYVAHCFDGSKLDDLPAGLSESTCPSETALIAERNCREAIRSAKGGAA